MCTFRFYVKYKKKISRYPPSLNLGKTEYNNVKPQKLENYNVLDAK